MIRLLGVVVLLAAFPARSASPALDLVACMQGNVLPGSQVQELELEATDIHGETRVLKGKLFSTRENLPEAAGLLRATLRITAPTHLAGAAYLLRQGGDRRFDGMFVYLPAVKRVRRVSAEFSDGSLLGTNFSYQEFKQLANAFGDLQGKVEGDEKYEGREVSVMTFSAPPGGAMAEYSSVKLRVDRQSCVALSAEFMKGTTVRKRFSAAPSALRQGKGFWYLSELEMRDLLDDTRTVLRVLKLEAVNQIPKPTFEPATFYLGD